MSDVLAFALSKVSLEAIMGGPKRLQLLGQLVALGAKPLHVSPERCLSGANAVHGGTRLEDELVFGSQLGLQLVHAHTQLGEHTCINRY